MLPNFLEYLNTHPYTRILLILILTLLFALFVKYVTGHFLKSLLKKTNTKLDDRIAKQIQKPVFWTVFLYGGYQVLQELERVQLIAQPLSVILVNILYILWAGAAIQVADLFLTELKERRIAAHDLALASMLPLINSIFKVSAVVIAGILIAESWGVNVGPIIAGAGIFGAALSFGAKDVVANFVSGISLFFDRTYQIGDFIVVDDQYSGEVVDIGIRSTRIRTLGNILLIIPNSLMTTNVVINETGEDPKYRLEIPLGVAYDSNLQDVEKILLEIANDYHHILEEPAPIVRYQKFGESSIDLALFVTIEEPELKAPIRHDLIKLIKERFDKENIVIPFPQRDLHFIEKDQNEWQEIDTLVNE